MSRKELVTVKYGITDYCSYDISEQELRDMLKPLEETYYEDDRDWSRSVYPEPSGRVNRPVIVVPFNTASKLFSRKNYGVVMIKSNRKWSMYTALVSRTKTSNKKCKHCKNTKDVSHFNSSPMSYDGHGNVCDECLPTVRAIEKAKRDATRIKCRVCGETQVYDAYEERLRSPTGYHHTCIECSNNVEVNVVQPKQKRDKSSMLKAIKDSMNKRNNKRIT